MQMYSLYILRNYKNYINCNVQKDMSIALPILFLMLPETMVDILPEVSSLLQIKYALKKTLRQNDKIIVPCTDNNVILI